jgi:hypothetical protein
MAAVCSAVCSVGECAARGMSQKGGKRTKKDRRKKDRSLRHSCHSIPRAKRASLPFGDDSLFVWTQTDFTSGAYGRNGHDLGSDRRLRSGNPSLTVRLSCHDPLVGCLHLGAHGRAGRKTVAQVLLAQLGHEPLPKRWSARF